MWLDLHNLYHIKETTPYFLFTKYRIFVQNQLGDLFLKYRQYFRIPWWCVWRFLKMFLLFRSYHICLWFVTWDYMKILFTWLVVQETCVSRRNIFFRLWAFLVSPWYMLRTVYWVVNSCSLLQSCEAQC